jgi:hypothetical protein
MFTPGILEEAEVEAGDGQEHNCYLVPIREEAGVQFLDLGLEFLTQGDPAFENAAFSTGHAFPLKAFALVIVYVIVFAVKGHDTLSAVWDNEMEPLLEEKVAGAGSCVNNLIADASLSSVVPAKKVDRGRG